MRELRYPCRIAKLELSIIFTGLLLLVLNPLDQTEARPIQIDLRQQQNHRSLDHNALNTLPINSLESKHKFESQIDGKLQRFVHHETNKVILLTNGEEIKLYPLRDSDLTPSGGYYVIQTKLNYGANGWARPLISDVGYVFDDSFCHSFDSSRDSKNDCLVIFWLDRRNGFLHYGSFKFNDTNRIELLSSKFNANGNLKSLSDKNRKRILLNEAPPIDLCKEARERHGDSIHCDATSLSVDKAYHRLNVSLSLATQTSRSLGDKSHKYVEFLSLSNGLKLLLDNREYKPKIKSNQLDDAMAMTASSNNLFWLNSNYELYSSDLAGHDTQLIEKLSPRPSLRTVNEIRSYRDVLLLSDMATKSIISYNITQRALLNRQAKPQEAGRKKKFSMVEKFESTHQVLLVETSPILKFEIINLKECSWTPRAPCHVDDDFEVPRVIDDDLTGLSIRRKIDLFSQQHLLEESMHLLFVFLVILLVIFILTQNRHDKQVKPDRESFVDQEES